MKTCITPRQSNRISALTVGASLALSALALACGEANEPSERDDVQGIVGGQLDSGHPAVGLVGVPDPTVGFCTATLIAPDWIATARHCKSLRGFYTGTDVSDFDFHAVEDRVYYAERGDVALLRLREPITDIATVKLATVLPRIGEECTAVGFGGSDTRQPSYKGIKRTGKLRVVSANRSAVVAGGGHSLDGGDSGGPLLCRGKIVGVASTGEGKYIPLDSAWVARTMRDPKSSKSEVLRERALPPPVPQVKLLDYSGALCPQGSLSIEDGVISGPRSEPAKTAATQTCTMHLSVVVPPGKMLTEPGLYTAFNTESGAITAAVRLSVPGSAPEALDIMVSPTSGRSRAYARFGMSGCSDPSKPTEVPLTVEISAPLQAGNVFNFDYLDVSLTGAGGTNWWSCPASEAEAP